MDGDDAALVVLEFAGSPIALTREELAQAIERGRALVPAVPAATQSAPERWLDAEGMETATGVPATWWLDAARRGEIECLRAGKYVRFRICDAAQALRQRKGGQ